MPACPDDGTDTAICDRPNLAQPGDIVGGNFRIVRWIGQGGFGEVYEATHIRTDWHVAIKLLRAQAKSSAAAAQRFIAFAKLCGRLHSPPTVRVADSGVTPRGDLYMAMEYLAGESLDARLKDRGHLGQVSGGLD